MAMTEKILDPPLWSAFEQALQQGLAEAKRASAEKKIFLTKSDWPRKDGNFDNGMPHFSFSLGLGDGPLDYSSLRNYGSDPESFPWYREFRDFCHAHDRIRTFYSMSGGVPSPDPDDFFSVRVAILLGNFIDAYIHRNKEFEYTAGKSQELYLGWERLLHLKELPLMLVVPLLFLNCEFEEVKLSPRISIAKLSESHNLARMASGSLRYTTSNTQRIVIGAATHALICEGWHIENQATLTELQNVLTNRLAFDLGQIENFFCSLRLAGPCQVGYGQVITAPVGWSFEPRGDLPSWLQFSIKRYPERFEDYYWLSSDISKMTREKSDLVREIFLAMEESRRKEFILARDRINFAALRDHEADAVIDATIALESLLTGDSKQEMTYKLAVRLAALSRLAKFSKRPARVFQEIKKLYDYRSAIVHGSTSAEKKREIKLTDDQPISAVVAAEEYAKLAMRTLLQHPKYLDPQLIDTELLLTDSVTSEETLSSEPQGEI